MRTFAIVATAAAATAATPVVTPHFTMQAFSTTYQLGSYPYISGANGEVPIITKSVAECEALCKANPACKYGTTVTAGATLLGSIHAFDDKARFGECWLSATTHNSPTKCGVACSSFKKVLDTEAKVSAPVDATRNTGVGASKVSVVPKADRKHNCNGKGDGKKCAMSCHCDPFAHPSAYTKCRTNPFSGQVQTYHLSPKFHTRPFHPSTQHRCAHNAQGCSCCSCDTMVGVHSFVGVGIGRPIDDVRVGTTGVIMDGDKDFFIASSTETCERTCSEQSYDETAEYIVIDESVALEITEGHSRLDCQARCDAATAIGKVPCAAISLDGKTCALFPARQSYKTAKATAGQVTLKRKPDAARCIGGTYVGGGVNGGKCFLGTKLMTEAECTVHPTKCLCSNAMACSSFRRRPNQFHTKDDVFQADVRHQHAALSSDCASIRGEICYNYYGCNGSNPNKACAKANLPAWLVNSRDVIPGKNQCCGANLNCVKDANSGEARCFSNKIADIGGTHMNLGAHAVQGQQVKK
jgi:hypothetical protein